MQDTRYQRGMLYLFLDKMFPTDEAPLPNLCIVIHLVQAYTIFPKDRKRYTYIGHGVTRRVKVSVHFCLKDR